MSQPHSLIFDWREFNRGLFNENWSQLNQALGEIRAKFCLGHAFRGLCKQQADVGFVKNTLQKLKRYTLIHRDRKRRFQAQVNPERADRPAGAGRKDPPPGQRSDSMCFLCKDYVEWMQSGTQLGFDFALGDGANSTHFVALVNPFPLAQHHLTIADSRHVPQQWRWADETEASRLARSLLQLAEALDENWLSFFNGDGAGATIRRHRHLQTFERPKGVTFPLEEAAASATKGGGGSGTIVEKYPIPAIAFFGDDVNVIASDLTNCLVAWDRFCGEAATASIIATRSNENQVVAYFIPRHSGFCNAPGMVGEVACVEILGELVLSAEPERQRLESGQFEYASVSRILAAVTPPAVDSFLKSFRKP